MQDRGLAYGDGLFETIKITDSVPLLWDLHLQRLVLGCKRLGLPSPDCNQLHTEALRLIQTCPGSGVFKMMLTAGSAHRGYLRPASPALRRLMYWSPSFVSPVTETDGIDVALCTTRLGINPALAGLKHLNRLEQVLARQELQGSSCAEGLMLDTQGCVIEGISSNLFLWFLPERRLLTPDLTGCGVAGVVRELILKHAPDAGITLSIASVNLNDLERAQGGFFCNALTGIRPVRRLLDWPWHPERLPWDFLHAINRLALGY